MIYKTYSKLVWGPESLDAFLNSIEADGYRIWIYREQIHRDGSLQVVATAVKLKEII